MGIGVVNMKAAMAGWKQGSKQPMPRREQVLAGGAAPDMLALSNAITPAAFNAALSPNATANPSAPASLVPTTPAPTPVVNTPAVTPAPAPVAPTPAPYTPVPSPYAPAQVAPSPYAPAPAPYAPIPGVPSFLAPAQPAYQPLPQVAPAQDVQSAYLAALNQLNNASQNTFTPVIAPNGSYDLLTPPPPPPVPPPMIPPPPPPIAPVPPSAPAPPPPSPPPPAPSGPAPAPGPDAPPSNPQDAEKLKDLPAAELKRLGATDKKAFLEMLRPAAEAAEKKYGVPAAVTLAQAALETGWGQHIIPGFNIFGVKGKGTAGTTTQTTREVYGGKSVTIRAGFAKYNNFYEGVEAHGKLFHNGYYDKAMNQYAKDHNPFNFANNITGTYATDPSYGQKLGQIMRQYHLA